MYLRYMLPVLLGGTVCPLNLQASEMEHVLVTAPIHKSDAQTALPVTVIRGDELRGSVASNIGETLGSTPGLANASFGPAVGQPVIRGQQGPRVTILQNGTGSGDASNISADHAVSVEPILADSIEVLRGPSTLLFGGGAIGGLVNVIDGRVPDSVPEKSFGALELRHGTANDENTAVFKFEGGQGSFAHYLSGVTRETNNIEIPGFAAAEPDEHEVENKGSIPNTGGEMDNLTVGGSFIFEQGYIGLAVSRMNNEYGLPPGAHGHHDEDEHDEDHEDDHDEEHEEDGHDEDHDEDHDEHEEGEEDNIRLDIEQVRYDLRGAILPHNVSKDHVIESYRWALSYSDYEHDEIEGNGEIGTTFSNEAYEGRLELVHRELAGFHGALGFQFVSSEFSAIGEEAFIPQTDINRYGLFLMEDFHHGDVIYELGVRLDRDTVDPDVADEETYSSTSLSASALWNLNDQWQLGLALSSSERAPVAEELFSNDGLDFGDYITHAASGVIEVGNANLDTEQAKNIDFTISYQSEFLDGFVTVYSNDFSDYIYLANSGLEQEETAIFAYRQLDAEFVGIEYELTADLGTALGSDFSVKLFGDAITGELDNGQDVPRMPPLRVGARFEFSTGALGGYVSVLDASEQDKPGDFEEATDAYTRWDAGLNYRFGENETQEYLLFVKLKNITDEEIRSSVSFLRESAPEAGRSIEAGIRMSF